uniref:Uncharacterized protein n=1 Tax=Arundo donax TaxID=35708 RepID=A0A0A9AES4_ARUDO
MFVANFTLFIKRLAYLATFCLDPPSHQLGGRHWPVAQLVSSA